MAPKERQQRVDLSSLEPEQLASVQQQLEEEIQSLAQSSIALQKAAGEFGKSGRAVDALAEQKEGERYSAGCSIYLPMLHAACPHACNRAWDAYAPAMVAKGR